MTLIDRIEFIDLGGLSDVEGIHERIKTLLLCAEGMVPGSRAFGLPREFLDDTPREAASVLAQELQDKCDIYIPEVEIEQVDLEYGADGRLAVTISIGGGESYDSGD